MENKEAQVGGECGIRSRRSLTHQRFRPDPRPSIRQIHSSQSIRYNRYSATVSFRGPETSSNEIIAASGLRRTPAALRLAETVAPSPWTAPYRRPASFIARRRAMAAFRSKLACMCIQNCGVVLKNCARRSAVSAVTPRLPLTSSSSRTVDIPSFCAAAACVISSGFRNSSEKNLSGMNCRSQTRRLSRDALSGRPHSGNVVRIVALPPEGPTVLLVDPDAVLPLPASSQGFEPVTGHRSQILESLSAVDHRQLAINGVPQRSRDPPRRFTIALGPQVRGRRVRKRPDHDITIYGYRVSVKPLQGEPLARTARRALPTSGGVAAKSCGSQTHRRSRGQLRWQLGIRVRQEKRANGTSAMLSSAMSPSRPCAGPGSNSGALARRPSQATGAQVPWRSRIDVFFDSSIGR